MIIRKEDINKTKNQFNIPNFDDKKIKMNLNHKFKKNSIEFCSENKENTIIDTNRIKQNNI